MLRWRATALLLAPLLLLGCGGENKPKMVEVKGKVTLDNKPLATGEIKFGEGGGDVPTILTITNGSYAGMAPVGEQRIEIHSYSELISGKKGLPGGIDAGRENIIPAPYNASSTLTSEVTESGPNEFNFDLKRK